MIDVFCRNARNRWTLWAKQFSNFIWCVNGLCCFRKVYVSIASCYLSNRFKWIHTLNEIASLKCTSPSKMCVRSRSYTYSKHKLDPIGTKQVHVRKENKHVETFVDMLLYTFTNNGGTKHSNNSNDSNNNNNQAQVQQLSCRFYDERKWQMRKWELLLLPFRWMP